MHCGKWSDCRVALLEALTLVFQLTASSPSNPCASPTCPRQPSRPRRHATLRPSRGTHWQPASMSVVVCNSGRGREVTVAAPAIGNVSTKATPQGPFLVSREAWLALATK
ncbi:hypothetical protein BKA80DRAFT_107442 [Phyllosticta citrichinensis]